MACVNVTNVAVLDNPAPFSNPFQVRRMSAAAAAPAALPNHAADLARFYSRRIGPPSPCNRRGRHRLRRTRR